MIFFFSLLHAFRGDQVGVFGRDWAPGHVVGDLTFFGSAGHLTSQKKIAKNWSMKGWPSDCGSSCAQTFFLFRDPAGGSAVMCSFLCTIGSTSASITWFSRRLRLRITMRGLACLVMETERGNRWSETQIQYQTQEIIKRAWIVKLGNRWREPQSQYQKKKWMSFNCQVGHKKLAEIRDEGQWREERLSRYAVRVNEEKKNLQITMSNINGDIKHNNKGISNKETNLLCCEVKVIVSRVTHVLCSERMHQFWNMELHGHNWV